MARAPRNETGPGIHHVSSRGNRKLDIFDDDVDRQSFLVGLRMIRTEMDWRVLSWCLMSNHFHLLVETPRANLGTGMKWLLCGYARGYNERHGLRDHLFGDRYWNTVINDADHLRWAARYVARNPVKAGLVARAEDWRWGSWPGRDDDPLTDDARLLEYFGGCRELYAGFVDAQAA